MFVFNVDLCMIRLCEYGVKCMFLLNGNYICDCLFGFVG